MANFVKPHMGKVAKEWRKLAKAEAVQPLEFGDSWPQPSSLSLFSDDEARKITAVLAKRLKQQKRTT